MIAPRLARTLLPVLVSGALLPGAAVADEVIFLNGDRLTGTIVSAAGGKLVFETESAGEVTIDLKKVKTLSSDHPVTVRAGDAPPFTSLLATGPDGQVLVQRTAGAPQEPLALSDIGAINPAEPRWNGEVLLNGMIAKGNTESTVLGTTFEFGKEWTDDRLDLDGEYFFGREKDADTGDRFTSDDFGHLDVKYVHDLTERCYVDGRFRARHDSLAELQYRLMPIAGMGYRWSEGPVLELFTEGGLAYVNERYETFGGHDYLALALSYGLEWNPDGPIEVTHTLDYMPSVSDWWDSYLLDTDASLNVSVSRHMFVEFRVEYYYDSTPAPSAEKADLRYILGPGWEF